MLYNGHIILNVNTHAGESLYALMQFIYSSGGLTIQGLTCTPILVCKDLDQKLYIDLVIMNLLPKFCNWLTLADMTVKIREIYSGLKLYFDRRQISESTYTA